MPVRLCAALPAGALADLLGSHFIKRAAPHAKHPAVKGGFYFDLQAMEPLVNTPGWVEALKDFLAAQDRYLLSVGVYRAITGRESPQSALDEVARRWKELTQRVGVDKQREAYRHVVRLVPVGIRLGQVALALAGGRRT